MSTALDHIRYSCGIAGEEVANYVDELERVVATDSDLIAGLRQQLAATQEDITEMRADHLMLVEENHALREQLTARVRELEEEKKELQALFDFDNARLDQIEDELEDVEYLGPFVEGIKVLKTQLAAAQLQIKTLRDALEGCIDDSREVLADYKGKYGNGYRQHRIDYQSEVVFDAEEALATPTSTEALDAYVAEKVKEIQDEHTDLCRMNAEATSLAKELTRQRDLAVEALESCGVNDGMNGPTQYYDETLVETAISTIKGSEK